MTDDDTPTVNVLPGGDGREHTVFDIARDHHITARQARDVKDGTDQVLAEKERRRRDDR